MKTIIIAAVALTSIVASPAFAASARHHRAAVVDRDAGYEASAGYEAYGARRAPSDTVVFDNRVVGQDPDRSIRTEIQRDNSETQW